MATSDLPLAATGYPEAVSTESDAFEAVEATAADLLPAFRDVDEA